MECGRLNKLVRSWYIEVQNEALAPARMVEFMEKHIMDCDVCLTDPDVRYEVKKITAIVLPPSKMTKQPKPDKTEEAPPPYPDTVQPDNGDNDGGDDVDEDAEDKPVMLDVDDNVDE
jgi:hypothetical protein